MENNVPYIVHEGILTRFERTNRRLWILCLVMFLALVGSNICWLWYESQFEEVTTTTTQEITQDVSQDADNGNNTFVGGDYNGYAENQTET